MIFVKTRLFTETAYSFQGSNITVDSLINHGKSLDLDILAMTDTRMHGAYKFYKACEKHDISPLIGLQIRVEPIFKQVPLNLVIYARNQTGYENMLKVASISAIHGVLKTNVLRKYLEGISVVLDSTSGEFQALMQEGNVNALKTLCEDLSDLGEAFYLGVENGEGFDFPGVRKLPFAKARYHKKNDHPVFETLSKILIGEKADKIEPHYALEGEIPDFDKKLMEEYERFIKSHRLSLGFPQAALPKFKTPDDISSARFLRALSHKGLGKRLNMRNLDYDKYQRRLEKELKVIDSLGYNDYFLIIWDVIKYAKQNDILVGPGRGSAPGSLVSYALGITSIDPIAHGLLFERFLNKARKTMPDIDIDFPDNKRDLVVRYVKKVYGEEHVALICTFGTFLSKSSLRDSARVLGIESRFVDEMSKKVANHDSVKAMIENDRDVANRMKTYPELKTWLNIASRIENLPRHVSTHAAGVIISEKPLITHTAIQDGLNTLFQTQFEQSDLEAMGLLKMDFLGLRNLSMIESILGWLKSDLDMELDLHQIPLDDQTTFRMLQTKSTTGIFQLESRGMRQLIKKMRIRSFSDIVVVLALFRPGPMESIPVFLERREKKKAPGKLAPEIDSILKPTQGILLYQEQIMEIAYKFAGYSLEEADILRRAVSKKDAAILNKERENFVSKAVRSNKDRQLADKIYDYIVKFANYGFNKSHSVAYALIAYWMAHLKANYPQYFLAVLMQNALNNENLMRQYVHELHEHGLRLEKPSVAKSGLGFHLEKGVLYYPLLGVKNMGNGTVEAFLEIKDKTIFTGFATFVKATREVFNKRHYEYLIYSGACDQFGLNKQTMVKNLESLINFIDYDQAISLDEFVYTEHEEYDEAMLKHLERTAIGFNIAYDTFRQYEAYVKKKRLMWPADLKDAPLERRLDLLGMLGDIKEITTRHNDKMAFLKIEDRVSEIDAVCFPKAFKTLDSDLERGGVYVFSGKLNLKEDARQFVVSGITKVLI